MPLPCRLLLAALLLLTPTRAYASGPSDEARIREQAERQLFSTFPSGKARLQVRVQQVHVDSLPQGRFELTFPSPGEMPRAHTQVGVMVQREGRSEKAGWALLYVAHYDSVLVAASSVESDAELAAPMVNVALLETTRFNGKPLSAAFYRDMAASGPLFATRSLRTGRVLRQRDVRGAYAADAGDPVLMTYRRGPIVLRLTCTAREPGAMGSIIRLHNAKNDTMYRARLNGSGTADWIETL